MARHKEDLSDERVIRRAEFHPLKVFLMTTQDRHPVEVFFTPGSYSDTKQLTQFDFDLDADARVYADKAFTAYFWEDLLAEAAQIALLPLRRRDSKKHNLGYIIHIQRPRIMRVSRRDGHRMDRAAILGHAGFLGDRSIDLRAKAQASASR